MSTVLFTIQAAPVGQLELSPQTTDPTQQQMDEETTARDNLLKTLIPSLRSLQAQTQFARVGEVTGFDLLGTEPTAWSTLNNYVLLLEVARGSIDQEWVVNELLKALPDGSHALVLGVFTPLASSSSAQS
jgi:hypothetical protein